MEGERSNSERLNITRLTLRNYRCFPEITIGFDPELTVLVAPNGGGKTALLDAVAVAFGPFVGAFDDATGKHFTARDIRKTQNRGVTSKTMVYAPDGVELEAEGCIPLEGGLLMSCDCVWRRRLASPNKARTTIRDQWCLDRKNLFIPLQYGIGSRFGA